MTKRTINISLIFISLIGFIFVFWWMNTDPTNEFKISLEGADNRNEGNAVMLDKLTLLSIDRNVLTAPAALFSVVDYGHKNPGS